jgi:hypothetical protein
VEPRKEERQKESFLLQNKVYRANIMQESAYIGLWMPDTRPVTRKK